MKKLAWLFMFISLATAGAIKIDVDQLRSPDHTKVWTPPAATTTLVGKDTTDALTNKTLDKLVLTTSQVDTTTTGANAVFPTPTSTMFNFNNASLTSVDGITAPANVFVVIFRNKTGNTVTINNETGVNTTFRIVTGTGAAVSLANDASLIVSYSTNYSRWYVTGGSGSGGGGLSSWITSHTYLTGDVVIESNFIYSAASGHTSGTFATDLAGGKWTLLSPNADLTSNQTIAGTKTFSSTIVGSVNGNAATVTTNANLTGPITSSGNTTSVASQTGTGSTFVMSAAPIITGHPTVEGVLASGATGTGKFVFDTSPTLVTPTLGVATATSINSTTIPTSKTLIVNTDNLGSLGATTSAQLAGVISDETGSGALVFGTTPQFTTSVAIGGVANANAALDVQSTTQVSMPLPRMTTTQKVAIASGAPTEGSFAYDTTTHAPSYFDGTSWQTGLGTITVDTDWAACTFSTLAWQGLGTVVNTSTQCRRTGSNLEMRGTFTTGTASASTVQIPLPNNYGSIVTAQADTKESFGLIYRNIASASAMFNAIATSGVSYFNVSGAIGTGSAINPMVASIGTNVTTGSEVFALGWIKIPIQGWSSNASTFSAANANYSRRAYTPTFTGFGTVTAINCNESRSGEWNDIDCSFTSGTVTGVEARVSLPNVPASNFASLAKCGDYSENQVFGYISAGVLCEPSTQYVTFARQDAATAGFAKALGTKFYSSMKYSFTARIPIAGWSNVSQVAVIAKQILPTVQKFTSGSGTYTTPAGVAYIKVRMVGGGAGGSGSGTSGGLGGAGGNSTFGTSLLVANGASGAQTVQYSQGAGGTASLGGLVGFASTGSPGEGVAYASTNSNGGHGGSSPLGGGGMGGTAGGSAGLAASTNSGSGGGGGSSGAVSMPGVGGSAGGYAEAIIPTPLATYSYAVGSGGSNGAAGASGFVGGAGAAGYIEVTEFYKVGY